jgi:nucleoside-triphosphatase
MKKHLFLEGSVQEGKSTLIRSLIKDYLPDIGGFSCQRLLDDTGRTLGFRAVPAFEALELTAEYISVMPGLFLHFEDGKATASTEIFTDMVIGFLEHSKEKKLILLDEVGGIELMIPEFRRTLYEILDGTVPCLGVIKLESGIHTISRRLDMNHEVISCHRKFRSELTGRFHSDIIRFSRTKPEESEIVIRAFIRKIFEGYAGS